MAWRRRPEIWLLGSILAALLLLALWPHGRGGHRRRRREVRPDRHAGLCGTLDTSDPLGPAWLEEAARDITRLRPPSELRPPPSVAGVRRATGPRRGAGRPEAASGAANARAATATGAVRQARPRGRRRTRTAGRARSWTPWRTTVAASAATAATARAARLRPAVRSTATAIGEPDRRDHEERHGVAAGVLVERRGVCEPRTGRGHARAASSTRPQPDDAGEGDPDAAGERERDARARRSRGQVGRRRTRRSPGRPAPRGATSGRRRQPRAA